MDKSKMSSFRRIAVALAFALPLTSTRGAHADGIGQPTPQEQEVAAALAARLGMPSPIHVRKIRWGLPGGCEALLAESEPVVEGNKRSWQQLYLGRTVDDPVKACPSWETGTEVVSEAGWTAARSQLTEMTAWRFAHAGGFVDVRLGGGVSYAVAQTLISALRDHSWRDERNDDSRRASPDLAKAGRYLASRVRSINSSTSMQGGYEVRAGNLVLIFRVDDQRVSLQASGLVHV